MHVAVLGAGYAGVALVNKLEESLPPEVEITLVDESESHLVQHLLHRVVRKPSLSEKLTIPIEELLTRAEHKQAHATDIDADNRKITFEDGSMEYDVGAVCLGAQTAFYGLPGVEANSTPLKRLKHAECIREEFAAVREAGGRVIVGGAGLSGVQVAGELAEMAREADTDPEVLLLEQREQVAPTFPGRFQNAVADELDNRGVTVHTGRAVERADEETVELVDGTELAYDQFVWTGGIAGQEPFRGDRPEVRADLRLADGTFGLGDAVRVVDANGEPVPATAQTAVRQADVAARNIERIVENADSGFQPRLARYRYSSLGWLVSVGDGTVAQVGPSVLRGKSAKALKTTVGAGYLSSVGAVENATEFVRSKFKAE